jgi:hypothetical protein
MRLAIVPTPDVAWKIIQHSSRASRDRRPVSAGMRVLKRRIGEQAISCSERVREAFKITIALQRNDIPALSTQAIVPS